MSLGLLFLKRTDRQGWFRIITTVFAITLATAVMLSAIAMGEAMTRGQTRGQILTAPYHNEYRSKKTVDIQADELVLYRYYGYGETNSKNAIIEIGMRQLTPKAPLLPGMKRAPAQDEVFVSTALANRIKQEPELKDYFANLKIVENVPNKILPSPDTLLALSYLPQEAIDQNATTNLAFMTQEQIDNYKPAINAKITMIIRVFMVLCGLGLIFPLLVLVTSATRIGVLQRQRRYAALSLVGTSKGQINRILIAESLSAGAIGVLLGSVLYAIIRRTLLVNLDLANNSGRFFLEDITVTPLAYLGTIGLIALLIVGINWWAMRKVKTSPLGVMKEQKLQQKPGVWRLLPLTVAIGVLAYIKLHLKGPDWTNSNTETFLLVIAITFTLMMVGLLLAGSYLTYLFSLIFNKLARETVGIMSSKRLKVFPKAIFSSVSGVVLAIFVGSFFITAIESAKLTTYKLFDEERESYLATTESILSDSTISFSSLSSSDKEVDLKKLSEQLLENPELKSLVWRVHGVRFYGSEQSGFVGEAYTCHDLSQYTTLKCSDNLSANDWVIIKRDYNTETNTSTVDLVPIKPEDMKNVSKQFYNLTYYFKSSADLKRAKTLIVNYLANRARQTGEQIPIAVFDQQDLAGISYLFDNFGNLIDMVYVGTMATILIGGFSLAIATIGGFFERKHSFANLRLMGVDIKTLNRVVLVESIIPLVLASIVALIAGIGMAWIVIGLMVRNLHIALPEPSYFVMTALSLIVSLLIVVTILPILKRITSLEENRTE